MSKRKRKPARKAAGAQSRGNAPSRISDALTKAEKLFRDNAQKGILGLLEPFEAEYPHSDDDVNNAFNRLLAFGYAHNDRLMDAERVAARGLKDSPEALDYLYIQAFVCLSMREYDRVKALAGQFIKLWDRAQSEGRPSSDYTFILPYLSQVYAFIGSACQEKGELEEACEKYRSAIDLHPQNRLAYLNLVRVFGRLNRTGQASDTISEAIDALGETEELKMLAATLDNRVKISACMMVKDEEELLPGCLDSIRDWVDEIVVVDTGSSDRTVEIAESYGAKIYHQSWENNFSKHRNYSISLATGDWIFIIDADERFPAESVPLLIDTVNKDEHEIISVSAMNRFKDTGYAVEGTNSIRFFRRRLEMYYEGIVHNQIRNPKEGRVTIAPITLEHLGYDLDEGKTAAKHERTRLLLEQQIEEDPNDAFAWMNLAQLYRGKMDAENQAAKLVIKAATRAYELADPDDHKSFFVFLSAIDQLAVTHYLLKDFDEAERWCNLALEHKPDFLNPLALLAYIEMGRGEWARAIDAFLRYLDIQADYSPHRETNPLFVYCGDCRLEAFRAMGRMAEKLGRLDDAKKYYRQAFAVAPDDPEVIHQVGRMDVHDGDFDSAAKLFERETELKPDSATGYLGLAHCRMKSDDPPGADKLFRRALEVEPEHAVGLVQYGDFLVQNGQPDLATEQYEKSLKLGNSDPTFLPKLASGYFDAARYEDAAGVYRQLLEQSSENANVINNLGNCLFHLKRFDEAETEYVKAIETGVHQSATYLNLGMARVELNKPAEALVALEKYLDLNDDNPEVCRLVGDLYARRSEFAAAIVYYERALRSNPADVAALFNLSECYFRTGQSDAALLGYRQVATLAPDFAPAAARLRELEEEPDRA